MVAVFRVVLFAVVFVGCVTANRLEAALPAGYELPAENVSPDGRWGVIEPEPKHFGISDVRNQVIEVKTGRVVVVIEGEPGFEAMNHGSTEAAWTPDSRGLLWTVSSKWGPRGIVYVALDEEGSARQVDVLKAIQRELLGRLQKAKPKNYAAAVKQNRGSGSDFPDGFTIDVLFDPKNAGLPMRFRAGLTSNPKGIENYPPVAAVEAFITGALDETLAIEWTDFRAFDKVAAEREYAEAEGAGEGLAHLEDAIAEKLAGEERARFQAECKKWSEEQRATSDATQAHFSFGGCISATRERVSIKARVAELTKRYGALVDARDLPHE